MVELAFRALQVLAAVGGAYLVALWFVLIVWTYRDSEARSSSVFTQIFSTLLVVLFFIPGVLLYLLLRPKETLDEAFQRSLEEEYLLQDLEDLRLCPGCQRAVEGDYVLCPQCQTQLRESCASCGRLVDVKWPVCPYCASPQKERGESVAKIAPPPARFIAPGSRPRRERPDQVAAAATAPLPAATSGLDTDVAEVGPSVVRPLDRFRPRPAPAAGRDPLGSRPSVGDELLRSLEQREAAQPIAAGAPAPTPHAQPTSNRPESSVPGHSGSAVNGANGSGTAATDAIVSPPSKQ
jgi:RNA polymerase subunit RPABC4/transcription elongation factor Spt4